MPENRLTDAREAAYYRQFLDSLAAVDGKMSLIVGAARSCRRDNGRRDDRRVPSRGDPIPLSIALILFCSLVALVPLAHASRPDPTWIAGLYDEADHDDVVVLITLASGTAPIPTETAIRPLPLFRASCSHYDDRIIPTGHASSLSVRAPPTS
jgi:hypothetical protein